MIKKIKVLCCNDSMELVILSEKTQEFLDRKLEEEARKHYNTVKFNIAGYRGDEKDEERYERYREACYWHYHDVDAVE